MLKIMEKRNARILGVLLSLMLVLGTMCTVPAFADDTIASNEVTTLSEAVVYNISTADQLIELQNAVNNQTSSGSADNPTLLNCEVNLLNDIDMSGKTWTGIGVPQQFKGFTGTFNGNGHKISGISLSNNSNAGPKGGLFNLISNAEVSNLKLEGSVSSNRFIGGLAGRVIGSLTISNCVVDMQLTLSNGASNSIGGLVGQCGSGAGGGTGTGTGGTTGGTAGGLLISDCAVLGHFTSNTSTNPVGGMVGHAYADYSVQIVNSYVAASLSCENGVTAAFVANNATADDEETEEFEGVAFSNSYYLASASSAIIGSGVTTYYGTPSSFTAGALTAAMLNDGRTGDSAAWKTLNNVNVFDGHSYPALAWQ